LEALTFALFLMAVMVVGAAQWEQLIGPEKAQQALYVLGACCVFALVLGVVAIVMARKRRRNKEEAPSKGLGANLRKTLEETGASLGSWRHVVLNLGLALLQVLLVVGCFRALLPTVGLELTPDMPILAVSGVIAFGALSAIVLPPSLGAGPAAAAVFVFGVFGIGKDQALAFAAMSWVANTSPVLILGLVPLVRRVRHFGSLKSLIQGVDQQAQP
jgi:uncharacterized membrane protein YbhN (UPF0104 family)